jgi:hypothetical protein
VGVQLYEVWFLCDCHAAIFVLSYGMFIGMLRW